MLSGKITGTLIFKTKKQILNESNDLCARLYGGNIAVEKIPAAVIQVSSSYIEFLQDLQKELYAKSERGETSEHKQVEIYHLLRIVEECLENGCDVLVEGDYKVIENSRFSARHTLRNVIAFETQKKDYLIAVKEFLKKLRQDLTTVSWQIGVFDRRPKVPISELESEHPFEKWHWADGIPIDVQKMARVIAKDFDEVGEAELLKIFEKVAMILSHIEKSHWRHQDTNRFYRDSFASLIKLNFMLVYDVDKDRRFNEIRR